MEKKMDKDIKEILFSDEELLNKAHEMGAVISKEYEGRDVVMVGILKGCFMFMSDLLKNITIPIEVEFMAVSSYGMSSESSGVVRILKDLDTDIENKDVLIVEDIIDSGTTLAYLVDYLKARKARSVGICCLLDKPARRKVNLDIKHVGFVIPDEFIIGYGIDYAEKYRNLPFVASLKEEVYTKKNGEKEGDDE